MATELERLIIALKVEDQGVKTELVKLLDEARKAGREGEKALKPFETGLQRVGAEARAGLRPLRDYRQELKQQERELKQLAETQDKNTGEYRKTVQELTNVKRELATVTTEIATQETMFSKLGGSLTRVGGVLSIGVTAPLTVLGATGVKSAMQLEVFQKSLTTLVGDAELAREVFDDLYEFDTSTTFAWPSLTKATTLLAAFNTEGKDLVPTLGRLGDISAGVQMDIAELADTYGRMQVSGRVTMLELNQLMGRGIPIVQELAKNLGISEAQVKEFASSGKLGFADIEQAFITMTSEGGRFHDMMQSQTDTTQGRAMALRKEFEQFTDMVGDALLPTLDRAIATGRGMVQWFVDLDESTQSLIINTGLFFAALGPGLIVLGQMIQTVGQLRDSYVALRTAIIAARAAGTLMMGPAGWIALGVAAVGALALALSGRSDSLDRRIEKASNALASKDSKSLLSALGNITTELEPDSPLRKELEGLRDDLETTGEVGVEMADSIAEALRKVPIEAAKAQVAIAQLHLREAERAASVATAPGAVPAELIGPLKDRVAALGRADLAEHLQWNPDRQSFGFPEGFDAKGISIEVAEVIAAATRAVRSEGNAQVARVEAAEAGLAAAEAALAELLAAGESDGDKDPNSGKVTPPPTDSGQGKTPAEILAELEATKKHARSVADAHGDSLEALAAETQTVMSATTKAIDGLIAAGVDSQDARVQTLVSELGDLRTEADRLKDALTPRSLGISPTANVNEGWAAGQRAVDAYNDAITDVETSVRLGLLNSEDALQAHLSATESLIDRMIPLWGGLTDEQREYVASAIEASRTLADGIAEAERQAARQGARETSRQRQMDAAEVDGPGAGMAGFSTPEEMKRWVEEQNRDEIEAEKKKQAELARLRTEGLAANRRAVAEARADTYNTALDANSLGIALRKAIGDESLEDLEALETEIVTILNDLGDDPSAAPFMGLLTKLRAAKAAIEKEAEDLVDYLKAMNQPGRQRVMGAAEVEGPGAGMSTGMTQEQLRAALRGSPAGMRKIILDELTSGLELADAQMEAFGERMDGTSAKARLIEAAIVSLLQQGVAPSSSQIQELVAQWGEYQDALDEIAAQDARVKAFTDAMDYARDALGEMSGPLEQNIDTLRKYRDSLDLSEEGATALAVEIDRLIAGLERLQGIEDSKLRKLGSDLTQLAGDLPGLGGAFARSTGLVAEGLHKIAETDDKLEGTALVIRGVSSAIEALTDASNDRGLNGNQVMELVGGIASVAAEAVGTLTGIPGLGKVVGAAFSLIHALVGDLSDGLAEIEEQVEGTAKRLPLVAKDTIQSIAAEYTRQVSAGGSFGRTKAELDQEAYDAAVGVANSFASALATALTASNYGESFDLGFDRILREQMANAFVLTPEVQDLILKMVDFWKRAWEDGELSAEELAQWEAYRSELRRRGEEGRRILEEAGLLEDDPARRPRSTGSRVNELTGPARDHFSDLLAPLRHLGAQLSTLQDIRNILDARLPTLGQVGHAALPGGGVVINGDLTVTTAATSARDLFDEISRIANRKGRGQ